MHAERNPVKTLGLGMFRAKQLPCEDDLIASWNGKTFPLVSIVCTTYNHVGFIEDALRGFLFQETTFPFEIIVQDDVSQDGTREFLLEFSRRYRKIIKLVLPEANLYSRGIRPLLHAKNFARANLIAICEGDDYWIDMMKLQKQVTAIQDSDNIMLVHTSGLLQTSRNKFRLVRPYVEKAFENRTSGAITMLRRNEVLTATTLYKREVLVELEKSGRLDPSWSFADYALTLQAASMGRIIKLPDVTAVYRKVEGSLTNSGVSAWLGMHITAHQCKTRFAQSLPIDDLCRENELKESARALLALCARQGDTGMFRAAEREAISTGLSTSRMAQWHWKLMLAFPPYRLLVRVLRVQRILVGRASLYWKNRA